MEDGQLILSGRPRQKPEIHGSINTSQGRFGFGVGFISGHRTASQLLSQQEAARNPPKCGTCASVKNFPPFGRRVAKRALRQNQNQRRLIALPPYKIRSLHAVLGFAG